MKKKLQVLGVAFLSLLLVACSLFEKETQESPGTTTSSTSQVASSSQSSSSSATPIELQPSTVVYLSDEEIDAIQTLGDYKNAFKSLSDTSVRDFDELMAQLPEATKAALSPLRTQMETTLAQLQESMGSQFANMGDDSTPIPAEGKEMLVTGLKQAREMIKQHLQTVRDQATMALNQ